MAKSDNSIVYASGAFVSQIGVFRSDDYGDNWQNITSNLADWHSTNDIAYALWIDPNDCDKLLVGTTQGIFRSTNGGQSYTTTSLTECTSSFTHLPQRNTIYAGTYGAGVFYSIDDGLTWLASNDNLSCMEVLSLDIDTENKLLYAGTNQQSLWRLCVRQPKQIKTDLNNDGFVGFDDYAVLADYWMQPCGQPDWCNGSDFDFSNRVDINDISEFTQFWLFSHADINSDGIVDLSDYAELAESFSRPCYEDGWCGDCDLDGNCRINWADLRILAENWLK